MQILDQLLSGVVTQADKATLNGQRFAASPNSVAAAAQVPWILVYNPSGSGKRIIIDYLAGQDTVATTIFNYSIGTGTNGASAFTFTNLLSGGAAGIGFISVGVNAAFGTYTAVYSWSGPTAAQIYPSGESSPVLTLPPNTGVRFTATPAGAQTFTLFLKTREIST
jgi:hypothetical protein